MKKELGKWLMDIAKYLATACILSSIFSDMRDNNIVFTAGIVAVITSLLVGLFLVREPKTQLKK